MEQARDLQPRYAVDAAGLAEAHAELRRREAVHAAFARQPGVSSVSSDWVDHAARHAVEQGATVRSLTAAVGARAAKAPHQRRAGQHRPRPDAT
jgi:hypothetical protein